MQIVASFDDRERAIIVGLAVLLYADTLDEDNPENFANEVVSVQADLRAIINKLPVDPETIMPIITGSGELHPEDQATTDLIVTTINTMKNHSSVV